MKVALWRALFSYKTYNWTMHVRVLLLLLVMKWIQLLQNVWGSFISNYSCWMKVETKTSFIHFFNYQRISGMQAAYLEEYHRSTAFHCKVTRVCLCYTQNISTCEKHLITHLRMGCPEMIYSTVGEQKALNMFLLKWTIHKQVDFSCLQVSKFLLFLTLTRRKG